MKSLPKVLFGLFVIGLLIFAVYTIYEKQVNEQEDEAEKSSEIKPEIINELRLGIAEFDTINPILSQNRNVQDIAKIIYEPLVALNVDYKAEPALATEWSKIEGNCYLIKLREGVKWHDGTNFTARDVKFTIDTIKSENISTIYKNNLKDVVALDIVDNYTVKLTLNADIPFFEYNLTFPILSEAYYSGQDFITTTKNKNPVGTGKYKVYAEEDGSLTLNQNKEYWNLQDNSNDYGIKTVHIYMYSSMGEVYNSFKIGNIDLITTNNLYVENYIGTIGYNKKEYKGREYDLIAFNTENKVLSYPEVRKAISYAIDRSIIISNVYNNKYYSADFPLDYSNWLYDKNSTSSGYNPAQVEKVLTENGWELKNSTWQKKENYTTLRTNFTLVVNEANAERVSVAENIKEQLAKVGINITIRKSNNWQYQNYMSNKNYDILMIGTRIGFSPEVSTYLGEGNFSKYNNEEMKILLNEVKNITETNLLKEKYQKIYEKYRSDMPFMSLYFNRNTLCYSQNLMGEITPNCYSIFYNIEKWYREY